MRFAVSPGPGMARELEARALQSTAFLAYSFNIHCPVSKLAIRLAEPLHFMAILALENPCVQVLL